jgi:hypothetical protein
MKKPKAKPKVDKPKRLKTGDYILTDKSGWFEIGKLVVHIFVPFQCDNVSVEIFPVNCAMDDDDVLAQCSAEQP